MATKTLYCKDAVPAGATLHRSLQDGGSVTFATTGTGWNAGTNAIGQACIQNGGSEITRTDGQWSTTLQPSGAAPSQTIGDCWRSELPIDGVFANTDWTFNFAVRSVSQAYFGRFKLAVRLWKSNDANGIGATELTSSRVASAATTADVSASSDTVLNWTWSPGGLVTLRGEYLFVQIGVEITTAGTTTLQDFDFRVGSTGNYAVTTPEFNPIPPGAFEEDVNTPVGAALRQLALGFVFSASSLLTTTLAPVVAGLPVGEQSSLSAIEYRTFFTRQSSPLFSRAIKTIGDQTRGATFSQRFRPFENTETSRGFTPPIIVAALPVGEQWTRTAPEPNRLVVDTSTEQSVTLKVVVQPLPTGLVAPQFAPQRAWFQPADSTHGTPKPLIADAQLPVGKQWTRTAPEPNRIVVNTSARQPITLQVVVQPLPIGKAVYPTPDRVRPVTDTTEGTPKTLTFDAQVPVGGQWTRTAPEPNRVVVNTTAGTPKVLLVEPLPIGAATFPTPDRIRPVVDTTHGFVAPIVVVAAPVGSQQIASAPDRQRGVADTSRGTPKSLTADAQAPVGTQWTRTAPEPNRIVVNTSVRQPITLQVVVQALPVGAAVYPTPDRVRPVFDTTRGTPKTLTADAQAPVGAQWTRTAPEPNRTVVDTSLRQPGTLQIVIVAQPAGLVAPNFGPLRRWFQPVDSTRGTPKTLIADAQAPVGKQWTRTAPEPNRVVVNTSLREPITLHLIVQPLPVGLSTPKFIPLRKPYQPFDTSHGSTYIQDITPSVPPDIKYIEIVSPDPRTIYVSQDPRTVFVSPAPRGILVLWQSFDITISPDNRTLKVTL